MENLMMWFFSNKMFQEGVQVINFEQFIWLILQEN